MPLPESVARKPAHLRRISCEGYVRDDGMLDIDACLQDIRAENMASFGDRRLKAGKGPLHEMRVRMTIDDSFAIREIVVSMDHTPFSNCPDIEGSFQSLKGVVIGPGWRRTIHEHCGGVKGCTHVVELLGVMATAAYQTMIGSRSGERGAQERKAWLPINHCHIWAEDGELVRTRFPDRYRPTPLAEDRDKR